MNEESERELNENEDQMNEVLVQLFFMTPSCGAIHFFHTEVHGYTKSRHLLCAPVHGAIDFFHTPRKGPPSLDTCLVFLCTRDCQKTGFWASEKMNIVLA